MTATNESLRENMTAEQNENIQDQNPKSEDMKENEEKISEKKSENLLYDSKEYNYTPSIVAKINVQGREAGAERFVDGKLQLTPYRIKIYDHKDYAQIDMQFVLLEEMREDKNPFGFMDFLGQHVAIKRQEHPNYFVWASLDIYPNPLNENAVATVFAFENMVAFRNDNNGIIMVSICATPVNFRVSTEANPDMPYTEINNIVEYNIITTHERELIKTCVAHHNELDFAKKNKNALQKILDKMKANKEQEKEKAKQNNWITSLNMSEQESRIFDPSMLNISEGTENPEEALAKLIGLAEAKEEVKKLKAKLQYRKQQKERKIFVENYASMHMCFTGAPGTGKTTVARIIAGILYNTGYIKENKCVEVNAQNLKGGAVGQTSIITKLVMKSAKNKVLFIDEAYTLFDEYENGYGKEAIAVILKQMEDERDSTIVIFAGYKDEMETFLSMNDGLKSRINRYIHFRNYGVAELTAILMSQLRNKKLYITEDALAKCILAFKKAETSARFSNGRFVRNLVEKIEYEHAHTTYNTRDARRQDTIEVEDIPDSLIKELLTRSM